MTKSELIAFFDNAHNYTSFEIRKKIYELTNNLDVDLLCDLREEYRFYLSSLKLKLQLENDKELEFNKNLNSRQLDDIRIRKIYIESFLKDNKSTDGKDEANIMDIIKDLYNRRLSDLPKNSRHKNNLYYLLNFEESEGIDMFTVDAESIQSQNDELVDLSDTSLIEKVIYLEKLGIIEFLRSQRPFNTSINSIANIFSAITGAKSTSVQPIVNPLINKDYYNKNNPLNSKKTVLSVENKLMSLGFEIKNKK
jgi:hypothetical protein